VDLASSKQLQSVGYFVWTKEFVRELGERSESSEHRVEVSITHDHPLEESYLFSAYLP
jgi:hypothetical protein